MEEINLGIIWGTIVRQKNMKTSVGIADLKNEILTRKLPNTLRKRKLHCPEIRLSYIRGEDTPKVKEHVLEEGYIGKFGTKWRDYLK